MYCKLAIGNVKKSIRDYTIYFLTLMFGVCLFYVFNSMDAQQDMIMISNTQKELLKTFNSVIGGVSVFVSVILGFLIIYANKFLIKRRKKELGIYMTLGMERGNISRILMIETLFIGIFALGIGIIAGIFCSQGLSILTAKIMETSIERFRFIFSASACVKAVIYFSIIFLVVIIFNTMMVSKCKLIDLLQGENRNESFHIRKLWISVVLFIISIICLSFAYYFIIRNGMVKVDFEFNAAIILGVIGTLLFFMSLSGFLLRIVKTNKAIYYRGLNMFILRQLNSKINTAYLSMSLICLMLLITIGLLSSGMGISKALSGEMDVRTPFDATFASNDSTKLKYGSIKETLIKEGFDYDKIVKEDVEVFIYLENITYEESIAKQFIDKNTKESMEMGDKIPVMFIRLGDYNKVRQLQGMEPLSLKSNEYAINCTNEAMKPYFIDKSNQISKNIISIGAREYISADMPLQKVYYRTSSVSMDIGTVILPDKALEGKTPKQSLLNVNYKEYNEEFETMMQKENEKIESKKGLPNYYLLSRTRVYEQGMGLRTIITFFVLYIGIVFLITSAAVLALQQLSESSDNIGRYHLLRKIGVENRMMNRSIFIQILIYFMMPLSLAIIHSIVGIHVANKIIVTFGEMNVLENIIFAGICILTIYGGYFYATYIGSRNMIKPRK